MRLLFTGYAGSPEVEVREVRLHARSDLAQTEKDGVVTAILDWSTQSHDHSVRQHHHLELQCVNTFVTVVGLTLEQCWAEDWPECTIYKSNAFVKAPVFVLDLVCARATAYLNCCAVKLHSVFHLLMKQIQGDHESGAQHGRRPAELLVNVDPSD